MTLTRVRAEQVKGFSQEPPFLRQIAPVSFQPNSNVKATFSGAFYKPNMSILISGQTVSGWDFIDDNKIEVSIITGNEEGDFNITLDNGRQQVFNSAFIVNSGNVEILDNEDWNIIQTPINLGNGFVKIAELNQEGKAETEMVIPLNQDFRFNFKITLGTLSQPGGAPRNVLEFFDPETGNIIFSMRGRDNLLYLMDKTTGSDVAKLVSGFNHETDTISVRVENNVVKVYLNSSLKQTASAEITTDLKIRAIVRMVDLEQIKFITPIL